MIYFRIVPVTSVRSWRWVVAETIGNCHPQCDNNCEEEYASTGDQTRGAEHEGYTLLTADPLLDQHVAPDHDESEN